MAAPPYRNSVTVESRYKVPEMVLNKIMETLGSAGITAPQSALANQAHYYEVTGFARAIDYPVLECRLDPKAEFFE